MIDIVWNLYELNNNIKKSEDRRELLLWWEKDRFMIIDVLGDRKKSSFSLIRSLCTAGVINFEVFCHSFNGKLIFIRLKKNAIQMLSICIISRDNASLLSDICNQIYLVQIWKVNKSNIIGMKFCILSFCFTLDW
jgi:hypothetical protein